jgi:hypothetical protein
MLSAVESSATQRLRLTLTRQLAEVLLRGVSGTVYSCPENAGDTTGQFEYFVLYLYLYIMHPVVCYTVCRMSLSTQQIKVWYCYRWMLWFIHYYFRSQVDHLQVIHNSYITCYSYCRYWQITMDPCKCLSAIYLNLLYIMSYFQLENVRWH